MEEDKNEYIASQQNLFSAKTSEPFINKIEEDKLTESDPSFMQFDLFNQNINVLKPLNTNREKVEKYENKYKPFDNLNNEIEPERSVDISSIKNEKKIVRNNDKKKINRIEVNSSLLSLVSENTTPSMNIDKEISLDNQVIKSKTIDGESNNIIIQDIKEPKTETSQKVVNEKTIFQDNDYKMAIGKLYNDAKRNDPYEANKYKSFKELFPYTRITETKNDGTPSKIDEMILNSEEGNINCGDFNTLNSLYNLQGITIKSHKSISKDVKSKTYTDKNKINMFTAMLTSFIMLIEIILSYVFIKNAGNFLYKYSIVYFIAGSISVGMVIVSVLENYFDRYKLLIIKPNFKKQLTARLLIFMIITIIVFALCLAFGMRSLGDSDFISFWLIPTLCSSNIVVYFLIYSFFLNQKYFNS